MNKNILLFLIFLPTICSATDISANLTPLLQEAKKEGLPLPDGGIQVKPMNQMSMSSAFQNELLEVQKQIKEKGYYETYDHEAKIIYNMRNLTALPPGAHNPQDTHLKSTIADVKLAFEFIGIPSINPKNVLGYAAAGAYQDGWTGITEIFTDQDFGTCQYTLNNIKLSHGSEVIPAEAVGHEVHGKITTIDVRGNLNSGYSYSIHWADSHYMNDLQCAGMTFDKNKALRIITLAKRIDKSLVYSP